MRKKGLLGNKYNLGSQELRAQGVKCFIDENAECDYELLTDKNYYDKAVSLVRRGGKKTAFFCSSDVYALELFNRFKEENIQTPGDAGLMGFDNLDILDFIRPRTATVSTSVEIQGREVVNDLFALIAGETVQNVHYVPHQICPGETL